MFVLRALSDVSFGVELAFGDVRVMWLFLLSLNELFR